MTKLNPDWSERCHRLWRSSHILLEDGDFASAVSRPYYAIFFASETLLAKRGLSFSSHQAVIAAFGKEFAKTGIMPSDLHRTLLDAFNARNTNEYEVRPTVTAEAAAIHIQNAEKFVAAAEHYLSIAD